MDDNSYSRYEEAIARALRFQRRHDPYNTLEWCIIALRYLPDDTVALRHKARAEAEIAGLQTSPGAEELLLTVDQQQQLDSHLLKAESYITNGAMTLARRELAKAAEIAPHYPHLRRLAAQIGYESELSDNSAPAPSAYDEERPADKEDKSLLIRRLAVAKTLIKSGQTDAAKNVLQKLKENFGNLTEIEQILDSIS